MADDTLRDPRWTDETLALAASLVSTGTDVTPMWQWGLADAPRRWEPLPDPGPEITAVEDRDGEVWVRCADSLWHMHDPLCPPDCPADVGDSTWAYVMVHAPLTDASGKTP